VKFVGSGSFQVGRSATANKLYFILGLTELPQRNRNFNVITKKYQGPETLGPAPYYFLFWNVGSSVFLKHGSSHIKAVLKKKNIDNLEVRMTFTSYSPVHDLFCYRRSLRKGHRQQNLQEPVFGQPLPKQWSVSAGRVPGVPLFVSPGKNRLHLPQRFVSSTGYKKHSQIISLLSY
jgi:hypothetical protein